MKYKSRKNLLEELKLLPYFSKEYVCQLAKNEHNYNLTDSTINTYISRYLKNKEIIQLKRGIYVSSNFYDKNKGKISYLFYLANILRKPSYVSSWAALEYYGLTTESIYYIISSITSKVAWEYKTKIANFTYNSLTNSLFSNFILEKGEFDFFIASPSKALFDLLYFKTNKFRGVKFEDIKVLVEELRIDIDAMNNKQKENFFLLIKKYIS